MFSCNFSTLHHLAAVPKAKEDCEPKMRHICPPCESRPIQVQFQAVHMQVLNRFLRRPRGKSFFLTKAQKREQAEARAAEAAKEASRRALQELQEYKRSMAQVCCKSDATRL